MKKVITLAAIIFSVTSIQVQAEGSVINGLDFGPLASLVGTWKTAPSGGVDVAPGQEGSKTGKGGPAVEPFYETITFEPAADAKNASQQYLVAMYYKQEVFRKRDNGKFHDQRGYLIYDKKNNIIYNTFCIPRAVCVVVEGKAGNKIDFKKGVRGIAESSYMSSNDTTNNFVMSLDFSTPNVLKYTQTTSLSVYGKPFSHVDSSTLNKIE